MTSPTSVPTDAPRTTLQSLTHHVARLHSLLQRPEPGLFTWTEMVKDEWRAICVLGGAPEGRRQ